MRTLSLLVLAAALVVSSTASADKKKGTELMASWSDPSKPVISGKKVLVVFQDKDADKRRVVETELAKHIKGAELGVNVLPEAEMLKDGESTRFQLKRQKIDYLAAVTGRLQLVPAGAAFDLLAEDYRRMSEDGLFATEPEAFHLLMARCDSIARKANALAPQT